MSVTQTMTVTQPLEFRICLCVTCYVTFAVLWRHFNTARNDGVGIHCPNGHQTYWASQEEEATEEALKTALEEARREIVALKERNLEIRALLEQTEARAETKRTKCQKIGGAK